MHAYYNVVCSFVTDLTQLWLRHAYMHSYFLTSYNSMICIVTSIIHLLLIIIPDDAICSFVSYGYTVILFCSLEYARPLFHRCTAFYDLNNLVS